MKVEFKVPMTLKGKRVQVGDKVIVNKDFYEKYKDYLKKVEKK